MAQQAVNLANSSSMVAIPSRPDMYARTRLSLLPLMPLWSGTRPCVVAHQLNFKMRQVLPFASRKRHFKERGHVDDEKTVDVNSQHVASSFIKTHLRSTTPRPQLVDPQVNHAWLHVPGGCSAATPPFIFGIASLFSFVASFYFYFDEERSSPGRSGTTWNLAITWIFRGSEEVPYLRAHRSPCPSLACHHKILYAGMVLWTHVGNRSLL